MLRADFRQLFPSAEPLFNRLPSATFCVLSAQASTKYKPMRVVGDGHCPAAARLQSGRQRYRWRGRDGHAAREQPGPGYAVGGEIQPCTRYTSRRGCGRRVQCADADRDCRVQQCDRRRLGERANEQVGRRDGDLPVRRRAIVAFGCSTCVPLANRPEIVGAREQPVQTGSRVDAGTVTVTEPVDSSPGARTTPGRGGIRRDPLKSLSRSLFTLSTDR